MLAGEHKVASGASTAPPQTRISWTIFPKIVHFPSIFCMKIFQKSIIAEEKNYGRHRISVTDTDCP